MVYKFPILLILVLYGMTIQSQDMQEGFKYLETGQYKKAETFFEHTLKRYPNNKTAKLCFGRAIGLNGNPESAKDIFNDLLQKYPNDFELQLNYAEALLWTNDFTTAKTYYKNLVDQKPNSFPALLGYANTLSNLKDYKEALAYVNNALEVSPNNPNALNSKKYMLLGYAYQERQQQQYTKAETLLQENLTLFNNDTNTLLNLAELYLVSNQNDKATAIYKQLSTQPNTTLSGLNGLALAYHLNTKDKSALKTSTKAYALLNGKQSAIEQQKTTERYIQALIWNANYKDAEVLIDKLLQKKPNANWVLALRATLNTYKSNFKRSLSDYNQILKNNTQSFDGNLGKANTLKALGKYNDAYTSAETTLSFYKQQKDATNFIKQLDRRFTPVYHNTSAFTFDNGNNKAFFINNSIDVPTSTTFKFNGQYNFRTTNNTITGNEASLNTILFGATYDIVPRIVLKSAIGFAKSTSETTDFTEFLIDIALKINALKLQNLTLGYKKTLESFNADLLNRQLVLNRFYANYNLSTNINLGWYTQYVFTALNDHNSSHLIFTSLYYNLLKSPLLKGGINGQYITFKDQRPTVYFSPDMFNAVEVFLELNRMDLEHLKQHWLYNITLATGLQYIDKQQQSTYRLQGNFGYKFSNRFLAKLYANHSNIASTTAAGFTFSEFGIKLKWHILKSPIFRNDLN